MAPERIQIMAKASSLGGARRSGPRTGSRKSEYLPRELCDRFALWAGNGPRERAVRDASHLTDVERDRPRQRTDRFEDQYALAVMAAGWISFPCQGPFVVALVAAKCRDRCHILSEGRDVGIEPDFETPRVGRLRQGQRRYRDHHVAFVVLPARQRCRLCRYPGRQNDCQCEKNEAQIPEEAAIYGSRSMSKGDDTAANIPDAGQVRRYAEPEQLDLILTDEADQPSGP